MYWLQTTDSVARIEPKLFSCVVHVLFSFVVVSNCTDSLSWKVLSASVSVPNRADMSCISMQHQKFRFSSFLANYYSFIDSFLSYTQGRDILIIKINPISDREKLITFLFVLTSKEAQNSFTHYTFYFQKCLISYLQKWKALAHLQIMFVNGSAATFLVQILFENVCFQYCIFMAEISIH